jgi:lysophospholipase L1-like esterase
VKIRLFVATLIFTCALFMWLFFSYAHIYNVIGEFNLKSPYQQNTFTAGDLKSATHIRYVALGDSLSAGVGSSDVEHTIVYQYAKKLSATGAAVDVVNLAWPGDETEEVVANQLPAAIEQRPDYVTVFIGINDIHEKRSFTHYRNNLTLILNELLTKTNANIVIINLPYLGYKSLIGFPFDVLLDVRTKQFNGVISLLPKNNRVHIVDLYTGSKQKLNTRSANYAADSFHPSDLGYMLWAGIINAN